jgi:hypothetical protein
LISRDYLSDRDREALRLAATLREQLRGWMARRDVTGAVVVTPFVDRSDRPNVLIRMDSRLALAIILSLNGRYGQTTT